MKDIVTPVPPEEVRSTIKKSLENAALDNYTRLSAEAKIEGKFLRTLLCRPFVTADALSALPAQRNSVNMNYLY